jgi:hypothetical protein
LTSHGFRSVVDRFSDGVEPVTNGCHRRRLTGFSKITFNRIDDIPEIRRQLAEGFRSGEPLSARSQDASGDTTESTRCRTCREKDG